MSALLALSVASAHILIAGEPPIQPDRRDGPQLEEGKLQIGISPTLEFNFTQEIITV